MPFAATGMGQEIIIPSEVSQTKTNITWYHLYVKSKKIIQMNLLLQNRNRVTHRKHMVTKREEWGRDKLGVWD